MRARPAGRRWPASSRSSAIVLAATYGERVRRAARAGRGRCRWSSCSRWRGRAARTSRWAMAVDDPRRRLDRPAARPRGASCASSPHGDGLVIDVLIGTFVGDTARLLRRRAVRAQRKLAPRHLAEQDRRGPARGHRRRRRSRSGAPALYQDWLSGADALLHRLLRRARRAARRPVRVGDQARPRRQGHAAASSAPTAARSTASTRSSSRSSWVSTPRCCSATASDPDPANRQGFRAARERPIGRER